MTPLTARQKRFVEEYLIDLNATQAAMRAGYSPRTAQWIGPQLLAKTHVSAAVQAKVGERSARTQITADWILQRLKEEATPGSQETSFSPARVKALELLGKHLALFADKVQVTQRVEILLDDESIPD